MAKIKFKIDKDKIQFLKGDAKLTQPIEPLHRVCEICNDDGKCLDNINYKDYEKNNEDFFGTDLYDCIDYQEKKNGTKGHFVMNWLKNIQKNKDKNKC